MKQMDDKEKDFFDRCVKRLIEFGYDLSQEEFLMDSGGNSVIMKGDLAGYSLNSLLQYVGKIMEKKVSYDQSEFDFY